MIIPYEPAPQPSDFMNMGATTSNLHARKQGISNEISSVHIIEPTSADLPYKHHPLDSSLLGYSSDTEAAESHARSESLKLKALNNCKAPCFLVQVAKAFIYV